MWLIVIVFLVFWDVVGELLSIVFFSAGFLRRSDGT
jgi:hypothetical protein